MSNISLALIICCDTIVQERGKERKVLHHYRTFDHNEIHITTRNVLKRNYKVKQKVEMQPTYEGHTENIACKLPFNYFRHPPPLPPSNPPPLRNQKSGLT